MCVCVFYNINECVIDIIKKVGLVYLDSIEVKEEKKKKQKKKKERMKSIGGFFFPLYTEESVEIFFFFLIFRGHTKRSSTRTRSLL